MNVISNRKAPRAFSVIEKIESGIELLGSEVKAIRLGHADLSGSHVKIINNQAFLINARIIPYQYSRIADYDEKRTRRLLLHKKQIMTLREKTRQSGLTLIPLRLYNKGPFYKLEVGLAKGKREFEKRDDLKKKAIDRDIEQEMKNNR